MSKRVIKCGSEGRPTRPEDLEKRGSREGEFFDFAFESEETSAEKPAPKPAPAKPAEKPAEKPAPKPAPAEGKHLKPEAPPAEKPAPAKPAEKPAEKPAPKPAPAAPAEKPVTRAAAPAEKPVAKPIIAGIDRSGWNGPGHAYTYWDSDSRSWLVTPDIWVADQAGNGVWKPIWAWYKDGIVHHVLDKEEMKRFCP